MNGHLKIKVISMWQRTFATLLGAVLAGCAGGGGDESHFVQLTLKATQENAGAIGQVALVDQGAETGLDFFIGGVPQWTVRPVNLLVYIYPGNCSVLGDRPAYSLNSSTQTTQVDGGWRMSRAAPVSMQELREGAFAVILRTTPADHSINIFCAETNQ